MLVAARSPDAPLGGEPGGSGERGSSPEGADYADVAARLETLLPVVDPDLDGPPTQLPSSFRLQVLHHVLHSLAVHPRVSGRLRQQAHSALAGRLGRWVDELDAVAAADDLHE